MEEIMNRHISEERLSAFVDNSVSDEESRLIRDHLLVCERCSAYVEEMRSLFGELSRLKPAPEETELLNETMQLWRIANQQPRLFRNRFSLPGLRDGYRLIAAGSVAAGLAVGILIGALAYQGLLKNNSTDQIASVVLQHNDQTINDSYVAMIINDGQGDL